MTRVSKCFRPSKTTTALHPSPTRSPLCSPYSTTNRVMPRGFTRFVHASRGIFLSFPIPRSRFRRFSKSCFSCVPFIHAMTASLLSLPPSRRIFLQRLSIRLFRMQNIWTVLFLLALRANQFSLHPLLVVLRWRRSLPIKMARSIALHGSGWRRTRQAAFPVIGAAL